MQPADVHWHCVTLVFQALPSPAGSRRVTTASVPWQDRIPPVTSGEIGGVHLPPIRKLMKSLS